MNAVRTYLPGLVAVTVILCTLVPAPVSAQNPDPDLYAGLQWREIGPFRGGRSTAVSGVVV